MVDAIREQPSITYKESIDKFGIRYSSVYERIKLLKQQKVLSREGGLYGGHLLIDENLYLMRYTQSK